MSRRPAEEGFTLLELLISLTLLGGIGVVMFGGLWYGLQSWHRSTVFGERADDTTVVRHALDQLLGRAYPLYIGTTKAATTDVAAAANTRRDKPGVDFTGTADSIRFLAPTPLALGGAGFTRFTLQVRPSNLGEMLVMDAQPELANEESTPAEQAAAGRESILLDHAKEIRFSYYVGNIESGKTSKWSGRWDHQAALPKLIRVAVEFPGSKWPDVTIATRIAVDASCSLDTASMTCSGR
jgi:type II secretory pathway pseudopilin PulG